MGTGDDEVGAGGHDVVTGDDMRWVLEVMRWLLEMI